MIRKILNWIKARLAKPEPKCSEPWRETRTLGRANANVQPVAKIDLPLRNHVAAASQKENPMSEEKPQEQSGSRSSSCYPTFRRFARNKVLTIYKSVFGVRRFLLWQWWRCFLWIESFERKPTE